MVEVQFNEADNVNIASIKAFSKNIFKFYETIEKLYVRKQKISQIFSKLSFKKKLQIKFSKLSYLVIVILAIILSYYIFIFWHLIPNYESTDQGLNILDMRIVKDVIFSNEQDQLIKGHGGLFHSPRVQFIIFHSLLFLVLWCFTSVILKNPGYFPKKYLDMYNFLFFFRVFSEYILPYNSNNTVDQLEPGNNKLENKKRLSNIQEMEIIIKNKNEIIEALSKLHHDFPEIEIETDDLEDLYSQENNDDVELVEERQRLIGNINRFKNDFINFYQQNSDTKFFMNVKFPCDEISKSHGCKYCFHKKPIRSHHCRHCKQCVLKNDHHCIFIGSCVGFNNYKQFFLFLIYTCLLLIYMIICCIQSLKFYFNEHSHISLEFIIYVIFCIFLITIAFMLIGFTSIHAYLIFTNQTTIENKEKVVNWKINFFYKNIFYNIQSVLGENPLLWFIPIGIGLLKKDETYGGYDFYYDTEKVKKFCDDRKETDNKQNLNAIIVAGNN